MRSLVLLSAAAVASARVYEVNQAFAPFSAITCAADVAFATPATCSCTTALSAAAVSVEEGYVAGTDTLACTVCAANSLTATFDPVAGALRITGAATLDVYTKAVASVAFTTSSVDGKPRRLTYNYGPGLASSASGHLYQRLAAAACPNGCRWEDAQTACGEPAKDVLGMSGYLATLTSPEENAFVARKVPGGGWMGAVDLTEGAWRWTTGPEGLQGGQACADYTAASGPGRTACNVFPTGGPSAPCTGAGKECDNGLLVGRGQGFSFDPAAYAGWDSGEPSEPGKDYGYVDAEGRWSSKPYDAAGVDAFVCEWGGVGEACVEPTSLYGTEVLVAGCASHTTRSRCDDQLPAGSCVWTDADVCEAAGCHKHEDEAACRQHKACQWDDEQSPPVCGDEYCRVSHATAAACNSDGTKSGPCLWVEPDSASTAGYCHPMRCAELTDSCACRQRSPGCVWSPGPPSHCVDPGQQCPPVDVVFLLDASLSMSARFGAHPVGFYGMMEGMRQWVDEAELAPSDGLTFGVRASLIIFGNPDVALSPVDSKPDSFTRLCEKRKQWVQVTGTTNNPLGTLSGDPSKLQQDVSWHENMYCAGWSQQQTRIKVGMGMAKDVFARESTSPRRKKLLFMITDGALHDRATELQDVKKEIEDLGVSMFGIVVRKTAGHDRTDEGAERSLKPLTSLPTDKHFINVDLDHFKEKVLNQICDKSSPWGSAIGNGTDVIAPICTGRNATACASEPACKYDEALARCAVSTCYPICTESECDNTQGCTWDVSQAFHGKPCVVKPPSCRGKDLASCLPANGCIWSPAWSKDTCVDNPCDPVKEEQACQASPVADTPCTPPAGDPDYCGLSPCGWDPNGHPRCAVKKCLKKDEATCTAEEGCTWEVRTVPSPPPGATDQPISTLVTFCKEKLCLHVSQGACDADRKCGWDAGLDRCVEKKCAGNGDEAACAGNPTCEWAVTPAPAQCVETECGAITPQQSCDANTKCVWRNDVCVAKTCDQHTTHCDCVKDDCAWKVGATAADAKCTPPNAESCPPLDVAFIIDGSGSMKNSFGNHPHGFFGLMEVMRGWVRTLALSGDNHLAGANPAKEGLRLTFIQFSKAEALPEEDHPTGCAVGACTNGLLSGSLSELEGDLTWHEKNYQSWWTYLHDALNDVADNTFLPTQSPPWRKHVVIIIADGGLTDINGDACCRDACGDPTCIDANWKPEYATKLDEGQQKLRAEAVTVFGIVMRRYPQHTFLDDNAELRLSPMVTQPKATHFMNLQLDEIPGKALNMLCDPSSTWGKELIPPVSVHHFPCATWGYKDECHTDPKCEWTEPRVASCASPTGCPELNCREIPAEYKDFKCSQCKLERAVVTCGTTVLSSITGSCGLTHCAKHCDEPTCGADSACEWSDGACQRKVCKYSSAFICLADADSLCHWNNIFPMKCELKECFATFEKTKCDANQKCYWDTGLDPPVCTPKPACNTRKQPGCEEDDSSCTWDCRTGACRDTFCHGSESAALCGLDSDCEWTGKFCREKKCTGSRTQTNATCCAEECKWAGDKCIGDRCKALVKEGDCNGDNVCTWSGSPGKCDYGYCPSFLEDEAACNHDPRCHWSTITTPASCQPTVCTRTHNEKYPPASTVLASCGKRDDSCVKKTDPKGDYCEPATCMDYIKSCECIAQTALKCTWDPIYKRCKGEKVASCPDLDVAVLLDGSGSMGRPFGSHPHGYRAMLEILRDWVKSIPLTEESHTKGLASDKIGGTFRVAFVQFSVNNQYWTCKNDGSGCSGRGCKTPDFADTCTDGELSGSLAELETDLDWHETNYMGANTYLAGAVGDAVNVFKLSPPHRMHVLLILTDGELNPREPQTTHEIPPAKRELEAMGVITFGVVMRRSQSNDAASQRAEKALKPLVSEPHSNHFINVPMDEMLSVVFTDFCDPTGPFGKAIADENKNKQGSAATGSPQCAVWGSLQECNTDPSCEWTSDSTKYPKTCPDGGCTNMNCMQLTPDQKAQRFECKNCVLSGGQVVCTPNANNPTPGFCGATPCEENCDCETNPGAGCVWNAAQEQCQRIQCAHADPTTCRNDPVCDWNATATPPCWKMKCLYYDPASCKADSGCQWDGDTKTCGPEKPDCAAVTARQDCTDHASGACLWDCETSECINDPCMFTDQPGCFSARNKCAWDPVDSRCQKLRCHMSTEAACTHDPICNWDATAKSCATSACYAHSGETACNNDPVCEWDAAACGACLETYCHNTHKDETGCNADIKNKCRWVPGSPDRCMEKKCSDYTQDKFGADWHCKCTTDPDCRLDRSGAAPVCREKIYAACPDLDVYVAFDGSCSMNRKFGQHPNGFEAMIEMMKSWVKSLPLTGEKAAVTSADQTGSMRIGFAQWDKGVRVADCQNCACSPASTSVNSDGIPPFADLYNKKFPDAGNCGRMSGDLSELLADLEWHGTSKRRCKTWIREAEEAAAEAFRPQHSPAYRRKVLLLFTDGQIMDRAQLGPAGAKLAAEGVKTFGIVLQRAAKGTGGDAKNLATMRQIVSAPEEQHALSMQIDDVSSILDGFCDPNSAFGSFITKMDNDDKAVVCGHFGSLAACDAQGLCSWNSFALTCDEHPCGRNCGKAACEADPNNQCAFNAQTLLCEKAACKDFQTNATCVDHECAWDATKTPSCTIPACRAKTEAACNSLPPSCGWDSTLTPAACVPVPCYYATQAECLADPKGECDWDASCPTWGAPKCVPKRCNTDSHKTQPGCVADRLCEWTAQLTCQVNYCAAKKDEACCNHDPKCGWDVSTAPSFCKDKYCPSTHDSQARCDLDAQCQWQKSGDICEPKDCNKPKCDCKQDPKCFWSDAGTRCVTVENARCPTMDVVLLVDGSGTMNYQFGRHPQGFGALMEMLRDWMRGLPLTGELAGSPLPGMPTNGGLRIGMIQFSGENGRYGIAAVAPSYPAIIGTGGKLSGDLSELEADLDWHEQHFIRKGTMIERGLARAGDMFDAAHGAGVRQRVLIVISDGKIHDKDALVQARAVLDAEQVRVFGVVVRRNQQHTQEDMDAEDTLRPITSDPHTTHFLNVLIDEIPEQVLAGLCDPYGTFGSALVDPVKKLPPSTGTQAGKHWPCYQYRSADSCVLDPGCTWSNTDSKCADSPCVGHCFIADCQNDTKSLCEWSATGSNCWKKTECAFDDPAVCAASDQVCLWKPDAVPQTCEKQPCTPNRDEDACGADPDGCSWRIQNNVAVCIVTPCKHTTTGPCAADANCEWNDKCGESVCTEKCDILAATQCRDDPRCDWVSGVAGSTCAKRPCVEYVAEKCCADVDGCKWDVTRVPASCQQHVCRLYTTIGTCDTHDDCMWDATTSPATCSPVDCTRFDSRCPCDANSKCYWKPGAGPSKTGMCVAVGMGSCPTLDIVVVVDGSGSMSRPFGRHPHGFDALMEMMRTWFKQLPLNNEAGTVGLGSAQDNGGVRVALVQFGGVSMQYSQAVAAPGGVGTGGRLSGVYSELSADVDWHEKNFIAKGTMIEEGLARAVLLFKASPVDGRQRTLIIISDGEIMDPEKLGASRNELDREGVRVFGIVVRPTTSRGDEDDKAEATLKPIVSVPRDTHFSNVEIDAIPELVSGICDPNGKWGHLVVPPKPNSTTGVHAPCPFYMTAVTCKADVGCMWSDQGVACVNSPCLMHCTEAKCAADATNNCAWNGAQGTCEKGPDDTCPCTTSFLIRDQTRCSGNAACVWSAAQTVCGHKDAAKAPPACPLPGPCQHDGADSCRADPNGCEWTQAQTCMTKRCSAKAQSPCTADDSCEWRAAVGTPAGAVAYEALVPTPVAPAPLPGAGCTAGPVTLAVTVGYMKGQDSLLCPQCAAQGVTPAWDEDTGVLTLTSGTLAAVVPSVQFLTANRGGAKRTLTWVWASCSFQAVVSAVPAICTAKKCLQTNQTSCDADPSCDWVRGGADPCVVAPCVEHVNEKECEADPKCTFDVAIDPAACTLKPCLRHAGQQACTLDADCMWDADTTTCVPKTCSKHGTECACRKDQQCFWNANEKRCSEEDFGRCPVMDVALLLDGSGSMLNEFGKHPVGFYAMMEMVRDWVETLPLTGEDQTVGDASKAPKGGLRLGIIQFSGGPNLIGAGMIDEAVKTPAGVGTTGRLSGDLSELQADVDWHEANYLMGSTFIKTGLAWAGNLFDDSPPGRKRVLIIMTDGKLRDLADLTDARAVLTRQQVDVFGVVLRPTPKHGNEDAQAEAALKPLTSDPHEDHFYNLEIDELPTKVLNGICDPNSKWGKLLADDQTGGHKPCKQYTDAKGCEADSGCTFSAAGLQCVTSGCVQHCEQVPCTDDAACVWANNGCWKKKLCGATDAVACAADDRCAWNATASPPACAERVCGAQSQDECKADPVGCKWLGVEKRCVEDVCSKVSTQAACTGACMWGECPAMAQGASCVDEPCNGLAAAACGAERRCAWSGTACAPHQCGRYGTEQCCASDLSCAWDVSVSPGACALRYCSRHTTSPLCSDDPKCKWDGGKCLRTDCEDITNACGCRRYPECFWNAASGRVGFCEKTEYGRCPTMDLVVLFDGSSFMSSSSFGNHPNGYAGLLALLGEWSRGLPLSGEGAAAPPSPDTSTLRVSFVQFSGLNRGGVHGDGVAMASRAPGALAGSAGGALSGALPELRVDLGWHQQNQLGLGTMLGKGLDVAGDVFRASPNDGRARVLVIVTAGKLYDPDKLSAARADLDQQKVKVFGVVVRRFDSRQQADTEAEAALRPLLASEEHMQNLMLDEVVTKALGGICDPNSFFGRHVVATSTNATSAVHLPCSQYRVAPVCDGDLGCVWSEQTASCGDTPCFQHCTTASCGADAACAWAAPTAPATQGVCNKVPPVVCAAVSAQATCATHDRCEWVGGACVDKRCVHTTQDACLDDATGCEWRGTDCVVLICTAATMAPCKTDARCEWRASDSTCAPIRCATTDETSCVADPYCAWTSGTPPCVRKPCTDVLDEVPCNKKEGCEWSTAVAPAMCVQEPCAVHSAQAPCNDDAACKWDVQAGTCGPTVCHVFTAKCDCAAAPGCFWKAASGAGSAATCVDSKFGQCPTLDIVMLIDGSGSMSERFGQHKHGFYALMEMLRTWVEALPLSGEAAGTPSAQKTQKVRVAFVQFSGEQYRDPLTGAMSGPVTKKMAVSPQSVGTGGRLSGSVAELRSDVDWHEANYLARGTYIAEALAAAGVLFAQSPADGRQRVLIIFTDGQLKDADALAPARAVLTSLQVEVFGVVLRQKAVKQPLDLKAEETLFPITSDPHTDHFANVQIDEVPGRILNGICDPNGLWGHIVVGKEADQAGVHRPCKDYLGREECGGDKGCAWSVDRAACLDSPCVKHCSQTLCAADAGDYCAWDGTGCFTSCSNPPVCSDVLCAYPTEPGCASDARCEWSSLAATKCAAKQCQHGTEAACAAASGCEWDDCAQTCSKQVALCPYSVQANCTADARCAWSGGACGSTPCGSRVGEKCCNQNPDCLWNVGQAPAACALRECRALKDQVACVAAPGRACAWDASAQKCLRKRCAGLARCACNTDPDCFWDTAASPQAACQSQRFALCPAMDVVLLVDGGHSMGAAFGRHPHGFDAVVAAVREWAAVLPLSGEAAGAAVGAPPAHTSRLSVVQFAGSLAWAPGHEKQALTPPSGAAGTSGGRLTGSLAEVKADLSFHEANFMGASSVYQPDAKKTYVQGGLTKAAALFNAVADEKPARKRVLIAVSDDPIDDVNGYGEQLQELARLDVEVFGIALRKQAGLTVKNEQAVTDLATVVSAPSAEHLYAGTIDSVLPTLNALCLPGTTWGKLLAETKTGVAHRPCVMFTEAAACSGDVGCEWTQNATTPCKESLCLQHCEAAVCNSQGACAWDAAAQACFKKGLCSYDTQQPCDAQAACAWQGNSCVVLKCVSRQTDQSCKDDPNGCVWNAASQRCTLEPCAQAQHQTACAAVTGCSWLTPSGTCVPAMPEMCTPHPNALLCGANDACEWKDDACRVKYCSRYANTTTCAADKECAWEGGKCVWFLACNHPGETPCTADAGCRWNALSRACEERPCAFTNKMDCEVANRCTWLASNSTCVPAVCESRACSNGWTGAGCDECRLARLDDGRCGCDAAATCSGRGQCAADETCVCRVGWGGVDCSERACGAAGAVWYTAAPNPPREDELFTVIVHGCFDSRSDTGRTVKVVKVANGVTPAASCQSVAAADCATSTGML